MQSSTHSPFSVSRSWSAGLLLGIAALFSSTAESRAQAPTGPEGLKAVGPIDSLTNYPMWYEDKHGLKIGLCTNKDHCFFLPPDPAIVARAPSGPDDTTFNWPDETFFYACENGLDGVNGTRGVLIHAVEAAYGTGDVKFGAEIVFVRFRLHFWNLQPFQDYTFTYPFGQETHTADGDGRIFVTRDVGIGAQGDFTGALNGEIGPFLLPVDKLDAAGQPRFDVLLPGTYLTNNLAVTEIGNAPSGNNFFAIEGPGVDTMFPDFVDLTDARPDYAVNRLFTVQGMIANRHGVEHQKSHYSRTPSMTSVDVFARSSPAQDLYVEMPDGFRIRMDERSGSGDYYAKIDVGAGAAVPSGLRLVNALDLPPSTKPIAELVPLITVHEASYALNGDLVVHARSSDQTSTAPLPLKGLGIPPGSELSFVSSGLFQGAVAVGGAPPEVVEVGGAAIRRAARIVVTGGNDAGTNHPIVANAGPDQNVATGTLVTLSGAATAGDGPRVYSWSQLTGTPVVLAVDPVDPAVVTFTAPPVTNGTDDATEVLSFQLAVSGVSTDTVLVSVTDPTVLPVDEVRITRAAYDVARRQWRIFGRTNLVRNQRVFLYLGVIDPAANPATWDRSRPIATVVSDGTGGFNYEPGRLSATGTAIPLPTDGFFWGESELGGLPGTSDLRRR